MIELLKSLNWTSIYIYISLNNFDLFNRVQAVPLYLSEMAPYKLWGSLNIIFQLCITIGISIAYVLNYVTTKIKGGYGWRVSLGGAAVPTLFIVISSFFLLNFIFSDENFFTKGYYFLWRNSNFVGKCKFLVTKNFSLLKFITKIIFCCSATLQSQCLRKMNLKKPEQYSSEFVVFLIRKLRLSSRILCQQVNPLKLWNTLGETFGIESIGLNWSCLWPFHFSNNLLASMLSCSMLLSFSKQLGLGIMLHSYPHSSPVESIVLLHWSPSMVLIDGVEDFFSLEGWNSNAHISGNPRLNYSFYVYSILFLYQKLHP